MTHVGPRRGQGTEHGARRAPAVIVKVLGKEVPRGAALAGGALVAGGGALGALLLRSNRVLGAAAGAGLVTLPLLAAACQDDRRVPVIYEPYPQPVYVEPAPPPVSYEPYPEPVYVPPAPPPVVYEPYPQPVYVEPAPPPVVYEPYPQPVYVDPSPPPAGYDGYPGYDGYEPSPPPSFNDSTPYGNPDFE